MAGCMRLCSSRVLTIELGRPVSFSRSASRSAIDRNGFFKPCRRREHLVHKKLVRFDRIKRRVDLRRQIRDGVKLLFRRPATARLQRHYRRISADRQHRTEKAGCDRRSSLRLLPSNRAPINSAPFARAASSTMTQSNCSPSAIISSMTYDEVVASVTSDDRSKRLSVSRNTRSAMVRSASSTGLEGLFDLMALVAIRLQRHGLACRKLIEGALPMLSRKELTSSVDA